VKRIAVALALVAVGLVTAPSGAHAAVHTVRVEDNAFTPAALDVAPGDTVTWTAMRGGHTITADDGRFDFPSDGLTQVGDQFSWQFDDDELVRYYCRIHGGPGGQGMAGVLRVGDPPTRPPSAPKATIIVPDESATIADGVAAAEPGTDVLVRPGVYGEEIVADVPGVTIRGLGAHAGDVVLHGNDHLEVGVRVAARNVRIENLTVARYRTAGVEIAAATGTVVRGVELRENGLRGIHAVAPAGLTIQESHLAGHGIAGVDVRDCDSCGTLIDASQLERNAAGAVFVDAAGVVVRDSSIDGNAVGIVLRSVTGAHVTGNTLTDNAATDVWVASAAEESAPPTGAGIWMLGGRSNLIASNVMSGHTYNVAVTGPPAAIGHRITHNVASDAAHADLGWDGIGVGVCFDDNRGPDGGPATTDPPAIAWRDCTAAPAALGAPYPVVTARLLGHAAARRGTSAA